MTKEHSQIDGVREDLDRASKAGVVAEAAGIIGSKKDLKEAVGEMGKALESPMAHMSDMLEVARRKTDEHFSRLNKVSTAQEYIEINNMYINQEFIKNGLIGNVGDKNQ